MSRATFLGKQRPAFSLVMSGPDQVEGSAHRVRTEKSSKGGEHDTQVWEERLSRQYEENIESIKKDISIMKHLEKEQEAKLEQHRKRLLALEISVDGPGAAAAEAERIKAEAEGENPAASATDVYDELMRRIDELANRQTSCPTGGRNQAEGEEKTNPTAGEWGKRVKELKQKIDDEINTPPPTESVPTPASAAGAERAKSTMSGWDDGLGPVEPEPAPPRASWVAHALREAKMLGPPTRPMGDQTIELGGGKVIEKSKRKKKSNKKRTYKKGKKSNKKRTYKKRKKSKRMKRQKNIRNYKFK
jgi:hypothetical protein